MQATPRLFGSEAASVPNNVREERRERGRRSKSQTDGICMDQGVLRHSMMATVARLKRKGLDCNKLRPIITSRDGVLVSLAVRSEGRDPDKGPRKASVKARLVSMDWTAIHRRPWESCKMFGAALSEVQYHAWSRRCRSTAISP